MADAKITAVAFDIGGVLLDWDPRHLYSKLIDDPDKVSHFLGTICTPQWHLAHDLGADTEQSCAELARAHPEHEELIMAWSSRGEEMVAGQLDDVVEVLTELASAGVRCFALSNMEADRFAHRRDRYPFFKLFEGCVISGVEGVAKPDRRIFEILRSRYALSPARTVFIDDTPRNVEAARQAGFAAIRFSGAAALRRQLREMGLPVA